MNGQEIIEMAIKAELNLYVHDLTEKQYIQVIEAFAKLVAAKATDEANARANASWTLMCKKMVDAEREACAMECIKKANEWTRLGAWGSNNEFHQCAEAIRARA